MGEGAIWVDAGCGMSHSDLLLKFWSSSKIPLSVSVLPLVAIVVIVLVNVFAVDRLILSVLLVLHRMSSIRVT